MTQRYQGIEQQREANDCANDARRNPGACASRLCALIAPNGVTRMVGAIEIETVVANSRRETLTAIAFRRSVIVDVNGRHARLVRALQKSLALGSRHLLGKNGIGTNLAIAIAACSANGQSTA
jgi:hypothetical protein